MNYYFGIVLAIISNVFYHICQKSIPGHINPFTTLVVTYFTAGIACLVTLLFVNGHGSALAIFKQIHWASIALGFSIIGLEAGFLLAYRAGWKISLAAGIANAIVAALLVVIGLVFYREQLTLQNIIGIALCLAGLLLIQL